LSIFRNTTADYSVSRSAAPEYRPLVSFPLTHAQGCDIVSGIPDREGKQ
jgi:hypothetical protein